MRATSTATPALLRQVNARSILGAMRTLATPNVTELVAATGISRPTVDAVVDWLIGRGIIEAETSLGPGERGRPARRLRFKAGACNAVGLDLGVDSIRAVICDLTGRRIGESLVSLRPDARRDTRLTAVQRAVEHAMKDAGIDDPPLAAVAGCPGIVDPATGIVRLSSRVPDFTGTQLGHLLTERLGCPTLVQNDANLAALGEQWIGVARGVDHFIYLTAASEAGAGIIVDGHLVQGHSGGAGELGFLHLWDSGLGTIAPTFSRAMNEATERLFARYDPKGPRPQWREPATGVVNLTLAASAGAAGDDTARTYLTSLIRALALAAASLTLMLNPELIAVGGGNHSQLDTLVTPLHEILGSLGGVMVAEPARVEASTLGDQAVALGGARLALDVVSEGLLEA